MKPQPAHLAAARGPLASTEPSTDLLPAPPIDVRDDVQQRVGQVAVAVEGVVPPTDGYVGEVPVRRQQGGDAVTHVLSRSPPEPVLDAIFVPSGAEIIPTLPRVLALHGGGQKQHQKADYKSLKLGFMPIPAIIFCHL